MHAVVDDELPLRILKSVQVMTGLRSLELDVHHFSLSQASIFARAILTADKWKVSHLRIAGTPQLVALAIEHCCPDTLKALDLYLGTTSPAHLSAARHLKKLERLYLQLRFGNDLPIMELRNIILGTIVRDFSDIECLVLTDDERVRTPALLVQQALEFVSLLPVLRALDLLVQLGPSDTVLMALLLLACYA